MTGRSTPLIPKGGGCSQLCTPCLRLAQSAGLWPGPGPQPEGSCSHLGMCGRVTSCYAMFQAGRDEGCSDGSKCLGGRGLVTKESTPEKEGHLIRSGGSADQGLGKLRTVGSARYPSRSSGPATWSPGHSWEPMASPQGQLRDGTSRAQSPRWNPHSGLPGCPDASGTMRRGVKALCGLVIRGLDTAVPRPPRSFHGTLACSASNITAEPKAVCLKGRRAPVSAMT